MHVKERRGGGSVLTLTGMQVKRTLGPLGMERVPACVEAIKQVDGSGISVSVILCRCARCL
eukprot:748195-Hanusia_phi.AAC.3